MSSGGPESFAGDHGLCGVYYALVTDNKDPDTMVARVKVRFPWMPAGDRDETFWAQLCVPMAGDEFGTYWIPELDDQVLVMFLAGDIRCPVVIGGAWNSKDAPPESNEDGKNDFRLIKSRSGHRMIFDDSDKTKVVFSGTGDCHTMTVGAYDSGGSGDNAVCASLPGAIHGKSSEGVSFASLKGGGLNVWCPAGTLTIDAGEHVEITSKTTVEVKGTTVTAKGGGKAIAAAAAVVNLQGMPVTFG